MLRGVSLCGEGADAKVYGDTEKCNIGNMDNEEAPICTNEAVFTGGTKNDAGMFVNPVSVTLKGLSNVDANKKGRIVITKDSVKTVEISVKDVSKLVNNPQKISNLVKPAIACEPGKICEYEIKVRAGAIKSEKICGEFIIDNTIPRCEFDYDGNNKYKPETIKLSLLENVEGLNGKILIVKDGAVLEDSSNDYTDLSQGKNYNEDAREYTDGKYEVFVKYGDDKRVSCGSFTVDKTAPKCEFDYDGYNNNLTLNSENGAKYVIGSGGAIEFKNTITNDNSVTVSPSKNRINYNATVEDKAGNRRNCEKAVVKAEAPTCKFITKEPTTWLNDKSVGVTQTVKAECTYVNPKYYPVTIDTSKITTANGYVSISSREVSKEPSISGYDATSTFTIKYAAVDGKGGTTGKDAIKLGKGLVMLTNKTSEKNNESTFNVKVDTIAPEIAYDELTSIESGGWYKAPFKLKMQCIDNGGSGVNGFTVNGSSSANPREVSRTTSAKPVTYSTGCTDKAGNSVSGSKSYYVRVYKNCTCTEWNYETTTCKKNKYCTGYKYYWASAGYKTGTGLVDVSLTSSCSSSSHYGKYNITDSECIDYTKRNGKKVCSRYKYYLNVCSRSSYSYECGCKEWNYKATTCKTYTKCWDY